MNADTFPLGKGTTDGELDQKSEKDEGNAANSGQGPFKNAAGSDATAHVHAYRQKTVDTVIDNLRNVEGWDSKLSREVKAKNNTYTYVKYIEVEKGMGTVPDKTALGGHRGSNTIGGGSQMFISSNNWDADGNIRQDVMVDTILHELQHAIGMSKHDLTFYNTLGQEMKSLESALGGSYDSLFND